MENIFKLSFHVTNDKKKFGMKPNIELSNNNYEFNEELQSSLRNTFFTAFVKDIISCARIKN